MNLAFCASGFYLIMSGNILSLNANFYIEAYMINKLYIGLMLMLMTGWSNVPISLQTLTENPISDLPVIKNNPTVLQQKEVRLGGIIVSTNNEATRTKIEILIFHTI